MKKLLIPVLTLSLIAGGLYTGSQILAMGWGNDQMVDTLASKLGKSTNEVETAFESVRKEHQTQMQANYEVSLTEAVAAGELSEKQKQLLTEKHKEIQASREAERQQRQQARADLEAWAETNGIETKYLFGFGLGGMGMGRGGMGGRGMHSDL